MKKEMREQYLVIMHNGMAGEVECTICECAFDADIGLAVFNITPETARLVCQRCAEKLDPALEEQFGRIHYLEHFKKRVDESVPWFSKSFETVGVLGKILEFNEKKDVSYTGEMIGKAVDHMKQELGKMCFANFDDEIPF